MMPQANEKDTVKVHYTGKLEDGTVFDSSAGREPLEFVIGEEQVISGFEDAVVGMSPGETKTAEVSADEAYGTFHNELVQEVQRDQFPAEVEVEKGQQFRVNTGGGDMILTVIDTSDETVTLDANHPLAGKKLTFEIELVEIA